MELVGHDSKSMSAQYTHVGAEALEKGRRRTSRALNATEMLVAIEEGTRSAQTDRMYTFDEIKERIRQWAKFQLRITSQATRDRRDLNACFTTKGYRAFRLVGSGCHA